MDQKQSGGPGFPASGSLLLVTLIFGVLFVVQHPFHVQRPAVEEENLNRHDNLEDVTARLWEDPFSAVQRRQRHNPGTCIFKGDHSPNALARDIAKTYNSGIPVTVMGIMVFGGPYFEDIEWRIRCRHAALFALGKKLYVPEDAEHIGFITFDNGVKPLNQGMSSACNATAEQRLPEIVPYEWFVRESGGPDHKAIDKLLLLWLDDSAFTPLPFQGIAALKKQLFPKSLEKRPEFVIIGPAGSTNLKAMVRETRSRCWDPAQWKGPGGTKIYSPFATASLFALGLSDPEEKNGAREQIQAMSKTIFPNAPGINFVRTIHSDYALAQVLVNELKRRRIDPAHDHIALISEWDTFYGRELPQSFIDAVKRNSKCCDCPNIERFTYMRGIDGVVSASSGQDRKDNSNQNSKKSESREEIERPVGRSQFDYLRRLGGILLEKDRLSRHDADFFGLQRYLGRAWDRAVATNHIWSVPRYLMDEWRKSASTGQPRSFLGGDNGFKAFGILGSDVYDKILIMEALHDIFPDAIFFTTDLDARLLHPVNIKWTRNLIVVSSFGLSLNKQYQGGVPPFRSCYQTALFLAVQMALEPGGKSGHFIGQHEVNAMLGTPRIFEIGRHGAVDLSTTHSDREVHPLRHGSQRILAMILLLFSAGALFLLFRKLSPHNKLVCPEFDRAWKHSPGIAVPARYWKILALYLLVSAGLTWTIAACQQAGGEPLALFEGVSMWPSLFLRMAALGVSVLSLFVCIYTMNQNSRIISDEFHLCSSAAEDKPAMPAHALWKKYMTMSHTSMRMKRCLAATLFYWLMCLMIVQTSRLFVPSRGNVSAALHMVTILVSVPLMIFLIMWVADIAMMTRRFITAVTSTQEQGRGWDMKTFKQDAGLQAVPVTCAGDWLNIRLIAKHTTAVAHLVYLPVIVMVIMLAARLRYFDRWDMPVGLALVIIVTMVQVFYWPAMVRRSAEKFRQRLLHEFEVERIRQTGLGNQTATEQLGMMIEFVGNLKKGAFLPFSQQHWVRAIAMALGGGGGFVLVQYLPFLQ